MSERPWRITRDTLDQPQRELYDAIAAGPRGSVPAPFHVLLASPEVAAPAQQLGAVMRYGTDMPRKYAELAILCTARVWGTAYEWQAHAPEAARQGVPAAVIEAIRQDREPAFDDPDMALVYRFAMTAHRGRGAVPDELFEAAVARFGRKAVVELTALLGYYALLAMTMNVFGVSEGVSPFAPADAV
jgi:4-carboxymuconolactone decarboxylase